MVARLFELEERLPAWLRPTYRGALFILGMSFGVAGKLFVLAMLATLMLLAGAARGLGLFFELLGVAVLAGAAGGAIHGILQPVESWGRIGAWLRWALAIFGYVTTFALFAPAGPLAVQDSAFVAIATGAAALGAGCLILLDDRRPGRPSPKRFRFLRDRKQLWAAADRVRARWESGPAHAEDPGGRAAGFTRSTEGERGLDPNTQEVATSLELVDLGPKGAASCPSRSISQGF
jgi:hypothetical protein